MALIDGFAPAPPGAGPWTDASAYDWWFEQRWGRYAFDRESRTVLRASEARLGTRVVDVGCGTRRYANRVRGVGAWVLGVDREQAMLAYCHAHALVPLVAADALALPLREHALDVAIAITVLEFVSDPAAAMAEMARVVRPGGRILIGSLNPRSPWGIVHRHELAEPPWSAARFLARAELRALGQPYGRVELRSSLYALGGVPFLGIVGPLLERLGRVAPAWGGFQVLLVHKDRIGGVPRPDRR